MRLPTTGTANSCTLKEQLPLTIDSNNDTRNYAKTINSSIEEKTKNNQTICPEYSLSIDVSTSTIDHLGMSELTGYHLLVFYAAEVFF